LKPFQIISACKNISQKFGNEKGLTLLEMLIAAAIFSVGLLGIIGLQGSILLGNDFAGSNTVAKSLATDRLNSILFTVWSSPYLQDCVPLDSYCYRDIVGGNYTPVPDDSGANHANLNELGQIDSRGRFSANRPEALISLTCSWTSAIL